MIQPDSTPPHVDDDSTTALKQDGAALTVELDAQRNQTQSCMIQLFEVQKELEKYHERCSRLEKQLAELPDPSARGPILAGESQPGREAPAQLLPRLATLPWWLSFLLGGRRRKAALHISKILSHRLFDAEWYLQQYPDVAASGTDPLRHYLEHGAHEYMNPSPKFDTRWYLTAYPDVARSGANPLLHYVEFGIYEGRQPNAALQSLKETLGKARADNEHLRKVLHERDSAINSLQSRIESSGKSLEQLKSHNEHLQNRLQERNAAVESLQETVNSLQSRIESSGKSLEQLKSHNEHLQNRLQERNDAVESLQSALGQVQADTERLKKELQHANEAASRFVKFKKLRNEDLQELRRQYKQATAGRDEQQALLTLLAEKIHEAARYFDALRDTSTSNTVSRKGPGPRKKTAARLRNGRDAR